MPEIEQDYAPFDSLALEYCAKKLERMGYPVDAHIIRNAILCHEALRERALQCEMDKGQLELQLKHQHAS